MGPRINCAHSGGHRSTSRSRLARCLAAAAVAGAVLSSLAACSSARSVDDRTSPACVAGAPACPIELSVSADRVAADGNLSPEHSSASYAFVIQAPARLQWSVSGPAVRVVLAYPDGDVDGPGLPEVVSLKSAGRYVFSLSSNTMAEGIYGKFRLELRLLHLE